MNLLKGTIGGGDTPVFQGAGGVTIPLPAATKAASGTSVVVGVPESLKLSNGR